MGKYKQSLPEDIDITDPNEPDYGSDEQPDIRDLALWDIEKAMKVLENEGLPYANIDELDSYVGRLKAIIKLTKKPF